MNDTPLLSRFSVLSGFCALVPVPFLDDLLLYRTRKGLVDRLLSLHESPATVRDCRVLYRGIPNGCFIQAVAVCFRVITKTFTKLFRTVFFFFAIRSATQEMVETFLLGRSISRSIRMGLLNDSTESQEEAILIRRSFDFAMKGIDRQLFISTASHIGRSLQRSGFSVRSLLRRNPRSREIDEIAPEDLEQSDRDALEERSGRFEEMLKSPEILAFLSRFDVRFDDALQKSRTF